MGNIVTTIRRFLSNKNTVTILGVLLGIVVLYVGYNYRVNNAIEKVNIPYAKKTIGSTEQITQDAIGTTEVLKSLTTSNKSLIATTSGVLNSTTPYCVEIGTSVPQGAFFYKEQVVPCTSINSNAIKNMPDGYKPVTLKVDIQSTYGNSMQPGDYIDLYVKMTSDEGKVIYGEFITKLPILDVRDSNSKSIFYGTSKNGTPAYLLFGVPQELHLLISKANYVSGVTLVPVPGNASYTSEVGETVVRSEYLRNEILKKTQNIPDEVISD